MWSMTGFGEGEATGPVGLVRVQVSAVNHRHCQVHLRGDLRDLGLEDRLKRQVRDRARRGAITIQVTCPGRASGGVNRDELRALYRFLSAEASALGAPRPSLEGAARLCGRTDPATSDGEGLGEALSEAADRALEAFEAMRAHEGSALRRDLRACLSHLVELVAAMAERAPVRLETARAALTGRLEEALGTPLTDDGLRREVALLADRLDVREELTRLASHLEQGAGLCEDPGPEIGKRFEFLLQELGREVNTVGSKANDVPLTNLVLEAKNVLEQMREQAANVL